MDRCPHCNHKLFRLSKGGQKLKVATTVLVLHKSGEVEINCPKCKLGVLVPLKADGKKTLRKAALSQRHILRT